MVVEPALWIQQSLGSGPITFELAAHVGVRLEHDLIRVVGRAQALPCAFAQRGQPPLSGEGLGGREEDRRAVRDAGRSEEHTSELQSLTNLVCRLLLEKKKKKKKQTENKDKQNKDSTNS